MRNKEHGTAKASKRLKHQSKNVLITKYFIENDQQMTNNAKRDQMYSLSKSNHTKIEG